jgi:hypothetical protein
VQPGTRQRRLQPPAERRGGGAERNNRDVVRQSLDHNAALSAMLLYLPGRRIPIPKFKRDVRGLTLHQLRGKTDFV